MILGLGMDIVEIDRISNTWVKYSHTFAKRILHEEELAQLPTVQANCILFLASRFAVKEAAVKALGTGFSNGIGPKEIYVTHNEHGKPLLHFTGNALERYNSFNPKSAHVTITHCKRTAGAVVILES